MNRRVLFIAIAACVGVAAIILLVAIWPSSEEPETVVVERRAPAASTGPRATTPRAPATPPEAAPRVEEAPEAAPAEAAAPVPAPEPAPDLGVLRIETDVPGAQVFIDREFIGVAPITAEDIKPGTHQLNVSAEGYDGIAMPIDYETSNKDDAFSAALLDLGTFQVDYLAKNLRVRLPKGRQFNFTDPDGTADRLFVFHRDVERAREQLRKGDAPAGN